MLLGAAERLDWTVFGATETLPCSARGHRRFWTTLDGCRRTWTPLSTTLIPASARIASNMPGYLPSRSRIKYRGATKADVVAFLLDPGDAPFASHDQLPARLLA
jgi:hypothetical protein